MKINRIILIGNGFDRAHGLPTLYKDFIDFFWVRVCGEINRARHEKRAYTGELINIEKRMDDLGEKLKIFFGGYRDPNKSLFNRNKQGCRNIWMG